MQLLFFVNNFYKHVRLKQCDFFIGLLTQSSETTEKIFAPPLLCLSRLICFFYQRNWLQPRPLATPFPFRPTVAAWMFATSVSLLLRIKQKLTYFCLFQDRSALTLVCGRRWLILNACAPWVATGLVLSPSDDATWANASCRLRYIACLPRLKCTSALPNIASQKSQPTNVCLKFIERRYLTEHLQR